MYKILEIPLIQLKTEENDKKVFNIQEYATKLENINSELEHLYYTINENKISLEQYLKDNYNEIAEILKFTIYFNLPYFNFNKEYDLNINKIIKKDMLINSIILKLNDMVNIKLDIIFKINNNDYLEFKLNEEDCSEVLDIISRNYWFEKRESNLRKLHNIKPNKICYKS